MNWVDKLIIEYEQGRKELREQHTSADKEDRKLINSMIGDMTFALEWMKNGREPDTYRGADRKNIYQQQFIKDMDMFQSLDIEPERMLTESEKRFIILKLSKLTAKERQCFILNKAYLWTQEEIGEELDMTRDAVKDALKRCENKFKRELF